MRKNCDYKIKYNWPKMVNQVLKKKFRVARKPRNRTQYHTH